MYQCIVKFLQFFLIFLVGNLAHAEPIIITWEDLSPDKKNGVKINFDENIDIRGIPDISEFDGSKEHLDYFLEEMGYVKEMQEEGGFINTKLNDKNIKIPGYITPIAFEGENVTEFLFVPYRGACIHVPAPPSNQIIYVKSARGLKADDIWSPKWITGVLHANPVSTIVANVGYSIEEAFVSPYKKGWSLFD